MNNTQLFLKDIISEKCKGCANSIPLKLVDGKLIHLNFFSVRGEGAIGDCKAEHILKKYLTGKDKYDNPIWNAEAKKAHEELFECGSSD